MDATPRKDWLTWLWWNAWSNCFGVKNTLYNVNLYIRWVTVTRLILHTECQTRHLASYPLQIRVLQSWTVQNPPFPRGVCAEKWKWFTEKQWFVASPASHTSPPTFPTRWFMEAKSRVPNESVPHSRKHGSHPNMASQWYVHVRQDLPASMTLSYGDVLCNWYPGCWGNVPSQGEFHVRSLNFGSLDSQ